MRDTVYTILSVHPSVRVVHRYKIALTGVEFDLVVRAYYVACRRNRDNRQNLTV